MKTNKVFPVMKRALWKSRKRRVQRNSGASLIPLAALLVQESLKGEASPLVMALSRLFAKTQTLSWLSAASVGVGHLQKHSPPKALLQQ